MALKIGRLDIFQGKMRGTFRLSGWKLSHWRVGECERAMGCSEVPMPVTGFPDGGYGIVPGSGMEAEADTVKRVVSDWSEAGADSGLVVGSGDWEAGLTWADCPGSA